MSSYIYAGGVTTQKVFKYDPSDMSKVDESADYGGGVYALPPGGGGPAAALIAAGII